MSSLDHQGDEIVRFVNLLRRSVAKFKRTLTSASVPAAAFSLHSQTQRFCRLPCLFIADVEVADRGADILGAEEFLDFPQILSQLVEQDRGCGWRNPCAVISPTPKALQAAGSRKLTARFENGAPEYPGNTNC